MFIVRPIKESDLDALERFAYGTSLGMLNLPKDRYLLEKKIHLSLNSFKKKISSPREEKYLFVAENAATGEVVGSSGIYSKTGVTNPLYYFQVETIIPQKDHLPLPEEIKVLHPIKDMHGPSELCSLFVLREFRNEHLGELLSRSRYLFISQHLYRFTETMLSRLRGFIYKTKMTSPFWDSVGRHFLPISFEDVEALHEKGTAFVEKFFPKYPIYVPLLSKDAQYIMQKTHITTKPALKMLIWEGFAYIDQVDFFDGGPVVGAKTNSIFSVKNNTLATVAEITAQPLDSARNLIISNTAIDFRACYGTLKINENQSVVLSEDIANALEVKVGDNVRFIATHKG